MGGQLDVSGTVAEEGGKTSLVNQVKAWQRMGTGHKEAWHAFVYERSSTNYDPSRHEDHVLQEFLDLANSGQLDTSGKSSAGSWGSSSGGWDNWGWGGKGGQGKASVSDAWSWMWKGGGGKGQDAGWGGGGGGGSARF